jgi:hypothetical protein
LKGRAPAIALQKKGMQNWIYVSFYTKFEFQACILNSFVIHLLPSAYEQLKKTQETAGTYTTEKNDDSSEDVGYSLQNKLNR